MANIKEKIEQAAIELAQARDRLNIAQRKFDELINSVTSQPQNGSVLEKGKANPVPQSRSYMTLAEQLIAMMQKDASKSWGYDDFFKQLPHVKKPAMRVLIYGLKHKGKIKNVGPGYYILTNNNN